jgi:hypothetical protein
MTTDFEKAVICGLLFRYKKNRRRKMWVHLLISQTLLKGQFHKLLIFLLYNSGLFSTSITNFSVSKEPFS